MNEWYSEERRPENFEALFERRIKNIRKCDSKEAKRHQEILEYFAKYPLGGAVDQFSKALVFRHIYTQNQYAIWTGDGSEESHDELFANAQKESNRYENIMSEYASAEIFVLTNGERILYYKHGPGTNQMATQEGDHEEVRDIMNRFSLSMFLVVRVEGEKFFNVNYFFENGEFSRHETQRYSRKTQRRLEEDLWEQRIREVAKEMGITDPREYRAFRLHARAVFEEGAQVKGSDTIEEIARRYAKRE